MVFNEPEVHSEPSQTGSVLAQIVNSYKSLIIDVRHGSKDASVSVTLHLIFFRTALHFSRFSLNKNKISNVRVKGKTCNSP